MIKVKVVIKHMNWSELWKGEIGGKSVSDSDPDPDPRGQKRPPKKKKISCFEVLDVLFSVL